MRALILLLATAAITNSAPVNEELADIEELLTAAKNREDASQEVFHWPPGYSSKSKAQFYPPHNMVPLNTGERKEAETERQWDSRVPKFPQTKEVFSDRNKDEAVDVERWQWMLEHPLKSQRNGQEKQTAKEEERATYPRYQQTLPTKSSETASEYLSRQADRMQKFIAAQEKRMRDYLDRQRNATVAYVRYERNRTIEYMRQERNNTEEFLGRLQPKREASKQEDEQANEELWGFPTYSPPPGASELPPPNTFLRGATSIRIPTFWSQQEKEDIEMARIQGFLRKIAPLILKKLTGWSSGGKKTDNVLIVKAIILFNISYGINNNLYQLEQSLVHLSQTWKGKLYLPIDLLTYQRNAFPIVSSWFGGIDLCAFSPEFG